MTTDLAVRVLEGEIVDEVEQLVGLVRVRVLRNPFTLERHDFLVAEGATLAEIVERAELKEWTDALVSIDGSVVPREWWPRVRPRRGHYVVVRARPAGSSGGGGKGWLQTLLGVVITIIGIVMFFVPVLRAFAPYVLTMGIGMIISGVVSLLMPPPQARLSRGDGGPLDLPVYAITGQRNQANPYGPVPFILGRHRIFPPFGALPYTEIVGNDQYLRCLFVVGLGKYDIEDIKIGETAIADFGEIEVEVRVGDPADPPLTLFTNNVVEEAPGGGSGAINLIDGSAHIRTTQPDIDEISLDFVWPRGLVAFTPNGNKIPMPATLVVSYRLTGSGDPFTLIPNSTAFSAAVATTYRQGVRWTVARGQYDVRVVQTDAHLEVNGPTNAPFINAAQWTAIRSITNSDPISAAILAVGLARIAIRVKASDRLNGVIDQLSCVATSIVPDYDSGTDTWVTRATRNPASLYRHVLQGPQMARPLADARIDLAALEAWHSDCVTEIRRFDFVVEQTATVKQVLDQVCAVGRATLGTIDGTFGVIRDIPQASPAGLYTPRNSRNYRGTRAFRDLPHALKAQFVSDLTWQMEERLVYWDGYHAGNATKFESLQFVGVTDPDQVWKLARYHLAAAYLRPDIHEFECDFEHLANTRGDRIQFNHDVPLFGITAGRIKTVTLNGSSQAVSVTLDEPVPMEASSYGLKWRRSDGVIASAQVVTVVGTQSSLTFTAPVAAGSVPAAGDLFTFGTLGNETVDLLIIRIEMLRDLSARIVAVDYSPQVYDADSGTVPPYDPHITLPPELRQPPDPIPDGLVSEGVAAFRTATGTIGAKATLHYRIPQGVVPLAGAKVQGGFRFNGAAVPWTVMPEVSADVQEMVFAPLDPGKVYDLRVRVVSAVGRPSNWVFIAGMEIPNPPLVTSYNLIATPFGYAATIGQQVPRLGPPRVTGLRLANPVTGNPNDTVFAGRDAKFVWNAVTLNPGSGDAEDDFTQDASIRDYVVEIWTSGVKRRFPIYVTTPGFNYTYEMNVEDHKPLAPQRQIEIRVWARSHDGAVSIEPAVLVVSNEAPDMSEIAPVVTALVDAAVADWTAFNPTDHDFQSYRVLLSTANPPLEQFDERSAVQKTVIIPNLTHGITYFLQIMPVDAFGDGIGSQIVEVVPKSAAEVYQFFRTDITVEDITFTADPTTNTVSWTAGRILYVNTEGELLERDISSGSGHFTTTSLFISWLIGETTLDAIPDPATSIVVNRVILAVYNGGLNLVVTNGKATVHGSDILAHTIGAAQLITNQALITGTAQINNGIITTAHINDATITTAKIQDASITRAKILDAEITRAKIAAAAIGTAQIEDASITSAKIGFAEIDTAHIRDLSVDTAKIKNLSVNGQKVTSGAISSDKRQGVNVASVFVSGSVHITFNHGMGITPLVTWMWTPAGGPEVTTYLYAADETSFVVRVIPLGGSTLPIGTLTFKYW
jgi:sulfur carrier protein ThiS